MAILIIDAAGQQCLSCLLDAQSRRIIHRECVDMSEKIYFKDKKSNQNGYGYFLPIIVKDTLAKLDNIQALSSIIVTIGPGSYTGLRVAVSYARALARGLKIPLYGVPSTLAWAYQYRFFGYEKIATIMETKRQDYSYALFSCDVDIEYITQETVRNANQLPALDNYVIIGDGASRLQNIYPNYHYDFTHINIESTAIYDASQHHTITQNAHILPIYLRPAA